MSSEYIQSRYAINKVSKGEPEIIKNHRKLVN